MATLVLLAACAPASESRGNRDTLLSSQQHDTTIAESVAYTAVPEVHGDAVVLAIRQTDRCATIDTQHLHRITHTERHTNTQVMTGLAVVGSLFTFVGVYGYTHADSIAAMQMQQGTMETPGQVRTGSIAAMTGGGLALSALVGSLIRARDTEHDNGVVIEDKTVKEYPCNERPLRGTSVTLDLGSGTVRGATGDDGRAVFSLVDVPPEVVPQRERPFNAVIGAVRVKIELADNEVVGLWRALADNPASRWAQDCNRLLDQVTTALAVAVDRSAADRSEQILQVVTVACTSQRQQDQVHALNEKIARLRAAVTLEEQREARQIAQQQGSAYGVDQLRSDKLRRWACSGDYSRKLAYGVVACLAPQAGPFCEDITKRGLKAAAIGLMQNANLSIVERAIVLPVTNALVIGLSADVGQHAQELCSRWVDGMNLQSPQQLSWNNCLFNIYDWTAQMCNP